MSYYPGSNGYDTQTIGKQSDEDTAIVDFCLKLFEQLDQMRVTFAAHWKK